MLFDTVGSILAVALPSKAGPWQPFLAYGGPDRRLLLKRAGAPKAVTCHVRDHGG
ncbi:hypothetical protein [Sphingomonas solaris]|uniref:hypothetical protein n=1 Tax=Alterirhizorhabdus solaris TaxID=2529389 RepID=UPI001396ABF2|nr:hypothetical protein [Sphingomonas solaris]